MASSPTHMLDTNMIIGIRRTRPPGIAARFGAISTGSVVMSVVTFGELLYGVEKSNDPAGGRATLDRLAMAIPVVDLGAAQAVHYADIRGHLAGQGMMIGANDLWIAAHARSLGLILVTNNSREFHRVPNLAVEDWTTA